MAEFPAIGHVALTVGDLGARVPWYRELIGADPVLDEDAGAFHHTVFLLGGTLLGLHQFDGRPVDAPYGSGLSFRDPDNIALEFFAPPS